MTSKRRRNRNSRNEERRFTVRGVRRDPPDIGKLSKALIGLAMAEAERQAQAEQAARDTQATVASSGEEQPGGGEGDA
jgi:hypothetical protein